MVANAALIAIAAFLAENITTSIDWLVKGGWSRERITALLVALFTAIILGFDVFEAAGVVLAIPYPHEVGMVLTGFLMARGANVLNDLFVVIQTRRAPVSAQLVTSSIDEIKLPPVALPEGHKEEGI